VTGEAPVIQVTGEAPVVVDHLGKVVEVVDFGRADLRKVSGHRVVLEALEGSKEVCSAAAEL
jgi:hypothetical protein